MEHTEFSSNSLLAKIFFRCLVIACLPVPNSSDICCCVSHTVSFSKRTSRLIAPSGILYVSGIDENATIAIYDLTGKLVKVTEEAPVNIADLAKGCYIVKITMGNTDKAMKFIKK